MQILLINLKRRSDRLAVMSERLKGLSFEVIEAVDGREWHPEVVADKPLYPLTKSELATIESHKKACSFVVDHHLPYACILEDDVTLSPEFQDYIEDPSWIPDGTPLIKIETLNERILISSKGQSLRNRKLHALHSYHPGAAGYIVSLDGARRLLKLMQRPDQAPDDIIFKRTLSEPEWGPVLQLDPALCIQDSSWAGDFSDSDIHAERMSLRIPPAPAPRNPFLGLAKACREVARPFRQMCRRLTHMGQIRRRVLFR